jgi:hypothetical protein
MFLTSLRSLASAPTVCRQLVVGDGVENQIAAQFVERQRFVVEHGRTRSQRFDVVLRRLRIHRDQHVDFFFAGDVTVLVGADRVPGRQSRDVRRKQVLPRNGYAHLKNAAQQNCVGTLRARPVYGRNLNAHVIDNTPLPQLAVTFMGHDIDSSHPRTFLV